MSTIIVASLLYLDAADPTKPIYLYINSPGGVVTSGLAIYDTVGRSSSSSILLEATVGVVADLILFCRCF